MFSMPAVNNLHAKRVRCVWPLVVIVQAVMNDYMSDLGIACYNPYQCSGYWLGIAAGGGGH
jgi:hypothetical protein